MYQNKSQKILGLLLRMTLLYKQQTKNSRKDGTLTFGDVVQIIEKRKNWSYVVYSSFEDEKVIEGTVFTRYLKQIK